MFVERIMTKSEIKLLQRALRETVAPDITVDGVYGNQTVKAMAKFCIVNGCSDHAAEQMLAKYIETRYTSAAAFKQAAAELGVPESYVRAVAKVETNGESFLKDGRVKILFERHWFYKKLKEALQKPSVRTQVANRLRMAVETPTDLLLGAIVNAWPNICNPERGGYKGGEAEWERLNFAMGFDVESACQATSFGGYQVMGFNHKASGYNSAQEMMVALSTSESKQLLAMVSFIKANPAMHACLKKGDWAGFAEKYNGSAYKENKYDTKLAAAEVEGRADALA
jgi:hypothetical protein